MSETAPKSNTTVATETPGKRLATEASVPSDRRYLERGMAVALLTLIALSWRLWWSSSTYPALPLISWLHKSTWIIDPWCSRAFLAITVVSLLRLALFIRPSNRSWWVVSIGLATMFLLDQHRLQPWAYQACLYGLIFAAFDKVSAQQWMRWLTASVYIYSACGKFDFQFLHTVGQQFVALLLGPGDGVPTTPCLALAAVLPTFELSVGLGLLLYNTSRCAGVGAMVMHAGLIIALGPWLLGHSWGVLTWNVVLLVQAWFLFVCPTNKPLRQGESLNLLERLPNSLFRSVVSTLLALSMVMPLTERFELWDHWLSWSLYSPHTSRVSVEIHDWAVPQLPGYLQPYLASEISDDGWRRLSLEQWSLQELGVPVYPQARYQLKLAISVAQQLDDQQAIRCEVKSLANRWTGERTSHDVSANKKCSGR